ncbi:carbon-nitrogen hydrolase family protein [Neptuniibacter halophilus]|uniref:carbon-nitrogen hydrolase family protein n=1 Tax=Neptuniibacter halophilus TaxID=651666 RepID=UPI002574439B|nr:carbon-nitrogen hydrolase family protein [Neptuniibacter halophilus]
MAKVAVAQMLSGTDLAQNLAQVRELTEAASVAGASMVLLPENLAMLDSRALIGLARDESRQPKVTATLSALAAEFGIWLVAGSVPLLCQRDGCEDKVFASCLVYDDQGREQARYDKIHLFDVDVADAHAAYRESDFIQHGDTLKVVDTPLGRLGLTICYDLRFPEQFQRLREMGAELISVPAAFTYVTGEAHWEVLLRARAIETQCYLLAPNQGGEHTPTRSSWGHSMIVDAWGEVLAERSEAGPGLVFAEIDLKALERRRQAMPVQLHRQQAGF